MNSNSLLYLLLHIGCQFKLVQNKEDKPTIKSKQVSTLTKRTRIPFYNTLTYTINSITNQLNFKPLVHAFSTDFFYTTEIIKNKELVEIVTRIVINDVVGA